MPDITFKVVPHPLRPGQEMVEIHMNGGMIAGIYANQEGPEIKLVSVHMKNGEIDPGFAGEVIVDDGSMSFPHIPALHVSFKTSPWSLTHDGKVLKH